MGGLAEIFIKINQNKMATSAVELTAALRSLYLAQQQAIVRSHSDTVLAPVLAHLASCCSPFHPPPLQTTVSPLAQCRREPAVLWVPASTLQPRARRETHAVKERAPVVAPC